MNEEQLIMQKNLRRFLLVAGATITIVAFTGCMNTGGRSTGRVIDDHSINRKVETALDDEQVYKFPAVKVTTYRGVTQLSGFVETEDQKRRAGDIAQHVQGPAEIINNITVRPMSFSNTARTGTGAAGEGTYRETGTNAPIRSNDNIK